MNLDVKSTLWQVILYIVTASETQQVDGFSLLIWLYFLLLQLSLLDDLGACCILPNYHNYQFANKVKPILSSD
jgi:hypothetical protein